ncbi:hypothetical protein D3C80_1690200 [compost metagenome]
MSSDKLPVQSECKLGGYYGLISPALQGFAQQLLIMSIPVGIGGIQQRNSQLQSTAYGFYGFFIIYRAVYARGHPHHAQSHRRNN